MDKRTILAVVLMAVILAVGLSITPLLSPPKPKASARPSPTSTASIEQAVAGQSSAPGQASGGQTAATKGLLDPSKPANELVPAKADTGVLEPTIYRNQKIQVTIDPAGANVTSLKLLEHKDGAEAVEMIMPGEGAGLVTRIGSMHGDIMSMPFQRATTGNDNVYEYYADFQVNSDATKKVRFIKRYTFYPNDFLFKLDVELQNPSNQPLIFGKDDYAYTLSLGPQIGPLSSSFNANADFRKLVYRSGNDIRREQKGQRDNFDVTQRVDWVSISGKYFSFMVTPGAADYKIKYSTPDHNKQLGSRLDLSRPLSVSANFSDSFRIIAAPNQTNVLSQYNKPEDNPGGQQDLRLNEVIDGGWLWWLEAPLKWLLLFFYSIIPNYGIAIILLTILIKVALYPLTKKGMESTSRMQSLTPQMNEIKEKYKDNQQKMNAEMAELYRREKINPLGGCLPILLQFPFFFAMYNLFYSHFDLRNAMFIPGWIPDLSMPETVVHFTMTLPIVNTITGLHILPFLYVGTQLLSTKLTSPPATGANNGTMKFMMYGMPIIFFFILYEVPSGLLVYWIFQNILQIAQQKIVTRHIESIKAKEAARSPAKVIKPQGSKSGSVIKKGNNKKTK